MGCDCVHWLPRLQRIEMKTKIQCNECGRKVRDNWESKTHHIMKYHPTLPLIRIATTMFSPIVFEKMGERLGDAFKRLVSNG